jgi:hypothetical protein
MKKLSLILMMTFLTGSLLFAQQEIVEEKNDIPTVTWNEKFHDFGKIKLKVPATATFTFENTCEMPVVITNVRSSCGCTVANYTKEPVKPGESGQVSATYNSARVGAFMKSVTVTMDGLPQPIMLKIKGEVVEKLEAEEKTEE